MIWKSGRDLDNDRKHELLMFTYTDYKEGLKPLYKDFDGLETKNKNQEIGYYEVSFTVEEKGWEILVEDISIHSEKAADNPNKRKGVGKGTVQQLHI